MTDAKPEELVDMEGPRGESVFSCLLSWLTPFDRMEEFQRELDEYWAHYKDLVDERAFVLVGALCVEDCLDRMINAFFPASKDLHENRDFTFSLKIDIVRACNLIPSRILQHCDLVRKFRNDFAHNLGFKTISDLGNERLQLMDQAIKSYVPGEDLSVPPRDRFGHLVGFVCVALKIYTTHVQSMRTFVHTADFMKALKRFTEGKK